MFSIRKRCAACLTIAASVVATLELAAKPAPALKTTPPREIARLIPNVITTDYYEVHGTTTEALLASMRANQPSTHPGSTVWRIDWNFEYLLTQDECILRSFIPGCGFGILFPIGLTRSVRTRRSRENGTATSALSRFTRVDMLASGLRRQKKWFGL